MDVSDPTHLTGPPAVIGQRANVKIWAAIGLTASDGIGQNRPIAKLTSDAQKSDGLTVVPADRVGDFLNLIRAIRL